MKAIPYTPSLKADWDEVVELSGSSHFMHKRDFIEYHADRFNDASILLVDKNNVIDSVFPANLNRDGIYSHQGLSFGGLICRSKTKTVDYIEKLKHCFTYYREQGHETVDYKCFPHYYKEKPSMGDIYALHNLGATLTRCEINSVVDLQSTLLYSSQRKRGISKAKKAGLSVTRSNSFSSAIDMINLALAKHGATAVHSASEISKLHDNFPDLIRLYFANLEDMALATVVTFENAFVTHAQYIALLPEHKKSGALDFLLDHLICDAEQRGKRFFSLGISTELKGSILNRGLLDQKEGFGASPACNYGFTLSLKDIDRDALAQNL